MIEILHLERGSAAKFIKFKVALSSAKGTAAQHRADAAIEFNFNICAAGRYMRRKRRALRAFGSDRFACDAASKMACTARDQQTSAGGRYCVLKSRLSRGNKNFKISLSV